MSQTLLKFLFVVTWLNLFVLLEPFLNKDGYRAMIWGPGQKWSSKAMLFLAVNGAILIWALTLSARL
jgi:hypothetical protein